MSLKDAILVIQQTEKDFSVLNTEKLNFKKECEFAVQLLESNPGLLKAAIANPQSLQNAIVNVAAIGLSLNPAEKLAFLVPRGKEEKAKVCLDESYLGKIKLGTDSGSIKWANAELVYENDIFEYLGNGLRPIHKFDPFGERGKLRGVYAIAETHDGQFLIEKMSIAEVNKIRDNTEAYKYWSKEKKGQCIWVDYYEDQVKKTVIRKGFKFWPKTKRVLKSLELDLQNNESPLLDFKRDNSPVDKTVHDEIKSILIRKPDWEKRLLDHMTNRTQGKVGFKSVDDFKNDEAQYALSVLQKEESSEATVQANEA